MRLVRLAAIALLAIWGVAAPRPAGAQELAKEAGPFVQSLGDQAIAIITDASLTAGDREARFRDMLVSKFDVPTIGRFVLGRHWRTATETQRAEVLDLFETMIVKTYNGRFSDYKGEQFQVVGQRADNDSAMVTTNVSQPRGGPPIKVDWRVLKPQGQLKIVDVMIEGVSMSVTQQQEFGAVVQRNGGQIDGLLATMRERVAQAPVKTPVSATK
jgi:phospholipid transport system substrate-binding protein